MPSDDLDQEECPYCGEAECFGTCTTALVAKARLAWVAEARAALQGSGHDQEVR